MGKIDLRYLACVPLSGSGPASVLNKALDEITNALTSVVFRGSLLLLILASIYILFGTNAEYKDKAKTAVWYSLLAMILAKSAPLIIEWLRCL